MIKRRKSRSARAVKAARRPAEFSGQFPPAPDPPPMHPELKQFIANVIVPALLERFMAEFHPPVPVVPPSSGVERLLLRPAEVAAAIGVSRSKVYELLASGALPSVRIGGTLRVPLEAMRAWIATQSTDWRGKDSKR